MQSELNDASAIFEAMPPLIESENEKKDTQIIAKNRLQKASELTKSLNIYEWIIKPIIPNEGLIEIIGASGSYKSFIALDMLFCIASGTKYHGHKTKKGTVVYVAGEGINGAKTRLRGLELHYNVQDYELYILPMPSNLKDESEVMQLASEIKELCNDVAVTLFDTLHRNSAGADENSANDWAEILSNIDKHLKPISKVVGWVHHTGVNALDRGRGTSSRYSSIETQILISKPDNKKAVVKNTKQKDAEEFTPLYFEFEDINTHLIDEDGQEVTTLYPLIAEGTESKTKVKLKRVHHDLIGSLRLAVIDTGVPISDEIKNRESITKGQMIEVNEWRAEALKVITTNGSEDPIKQKDAKNKAFTRYKQNLIDANQIGEYDGFVWIKADCEHKYGSGQRTDTDN